MAGPIFRRSRYGSTSEPSCPKNRSSVTLELFPLGWNQLSTLLCAAFPMANRIHFAAKCSRVGTRESNELVTHHGPPATVKLPAFSPADHSPGDRFLMHLPSALDTFRPLFSPVGASTVPQAANLKGAEGSRSNTVFSATISDLQNALLVPCSTGQACSGSTRENDGFPSKRSWPGSSSGTA